MPCKERSNIVAEYTMRDLNKPMGNSRMDLGQAVPDELKASQPSVEELEHELAKDHLPTWASFLIGLSKR